MVRAMLATVLEAPSQERAEEMIGLFNLALAGEVVQGATLAFLVIGGCY